MTTVNTTASDGPAMSAQDRSVQLVPPHSIEAEACVLGSMLLDSAAIDLVVQALKGEEFYRPAHQLIFDALIGLHELNKPIDLVSAKDELVRLKILEQVGGIQYLVALAEGVPNAANVEYYATIVRDRALLRDLISAGTEMTRDAYDAREEAQVVIDRAEQRVFEIRNSTMGNETTDLKELLQETFKMFEEHDGRVVTGLATGYDKLDNCTCGFQPGDMVILADRPSMGKTSLLMNMAEYMAVTDKLPVALFSLEMSSQQIAQRLLCSHARYDMQKMRRGMVSSEEWDQLKMSAGELEQAPLFVDDTATMTILQLRAKARRLKAAHDIQCVFIDYLQLMSYSGRANSRQEQITEISRGIKALGRELKIPIITAAQLNRGPEDRPSHRPRMSDLRESGSIEQDADVITLLHCEDYYHRGEMDYQPTNVTDLIVAKQRNGPTDVIPLTFIPSCTRFESASSKEFYGG